jgi:hypothetical protein
LFKYVTQAVIVVGGAVAVGAAAVACGATIVCGVAAVGGALVVAGTAIYFVADDIQDFQYFTEIGSMSCATDGRGCSGLAATSAPTPSTLANVITECAYDLNPRNAGSSASGPCGSYTPSYLGSSGSRNSYSISINDYPSTVADCFTRFTLQVISVWSNGRYSYATDRTIAKPRYSGCP